MMRGALFNSLKAMDADLSQVLDLYAGTGALGIEALSRGAGHCDFVERERTMADVIHSNLETTAFADRARVYVLPAERAIGQLEGLYTLVLADPPYEDSSAVELLDRLARSGSVGNDATVVYEHRARDAAPGELGLLCLTKQLRHGDSAVSIYLSAANKTTGGKN